jgi:geranylgeranyl diphosphate synthase type I
MTARPLLGSEVLASIRASVDETLEAYLEACSADLADRDPRATLLVEEISRLVHAGGKRLRPAFCVLGFRAAGGADRAGNRHVRQPVVSVASALELLHTMALIHDDLVDDASERRGVPSSASRLADLAADRGFPGDPARFGRSAALLAGDLAAVLADRLMLTSGCDPEALTRALVPYHEMRLDMAAGQLLDVAGLASEHDTALRAARLKGGSYTVEGPLQVGAALAGEREDVREVLGSFGAPLGEAFQLRDDLLDREGAHGVTPADVNELVGRAREALRSPPIEPDAAAALDELATLVAMR